MDNLAIQVFSTVSILYPLTCLILLVITLVSHYLVKKRGRTIPNLIHLYILTGVSIAGTAIMAVLNSVA